MKKISKKAQDTFKKLMWETEDVMDRQNMDVFRWANRPVENESYALIKDMLALCEPIRKRNNTDLRLNVVDEAGFDKKNKVLDIVEQYLNDRKEILDPIYK